MRYDIAMLADQIKERLITAMRNGNTAERDVLRVALGELQTEQSRAGSITEDKAQQLVRKMVKSNHETLDAGPDPTTAAKLRKENEILESLLPRTLSEDEVIAALQPVADAVKAAGNDGQATGVAMKHLKSTGVSVDGATVSAAVRKMRSS